MLKLTLFTTTEFDNKKERILFKINFKLINEYDKNKVRVFNKRDVNQNWGIWIDIIKSDFPIKKVFYSTILYVETSILSTGYLLFDEEEVKENVVEKGDKLRKILV